MLITRLYSNLKQNRNIEIEKKDYNYKDNYTSINHLDFFGPPLPKKPYDQEFKIKDLKLLWRWRLLKLR